MSVLSSHAERTFCQKNNFRSKNLFNIFNTIEIIHIETKELQRARDHRSAPCGLM